MLKGIVKSLIGNAGEILDENLSFNTSIYKLMIHHDSGSGNPNLTVIIK